MSVKVKEIAPGIGGVLDSVNISEQPKSITVAVVKNTIADRFVLVLPEQELSAKSLRKFASNFGRLFIHHSDDDVVHAEGVPEVLEIRKEPDGERLFGGADWHADVTFRKPAGHLSMLYAKVIPPVGGDTAFASTVAAFNALSPGMQALLRTLYAVHSYNGPGRPNHPEQTACHPVVRKHPETGAEWMYINRMFTTRFSDMTEAESRPLIEFLANHITRPEFTCRIRWHQKQLVIWDNRFTLHYPINDFTGEHRLLLRCTTLESLGESN